MKLCAWCENPVRNRYATLLLPDGETAYLHGKCSLMPEPYEKLGISHLDYKITEGPDGEILDFTIKQVSQTDLHTFK